MSQYHPCYKAPPELQKNLLSAEYRKVLNKTQEMGFETLFIQPDLFALEEHRIPDFTKMNPFDWS
jgi:putative pyruvate formate lyase activating enzyme